MGLTIAITNLILYGYSKLIANTVQFNTIALVLSTILCCLGAILIPKLPFNDCCGQMEFRARQEIPPWHLLLFGVFAFSAVGLAVQLAAISLFGEAASHFLMNYPFWFSPVGVSAKSRGFKPSRYGWYCLGKYFKNNQ